MPGLLEVIALRADDAARAETGGADRVEVVGTMDDGGMSPEPALVAQVRAATSIQVRPMVRLREGFGTDGGEATRLRGLIASYLEAGADGVVFGFLNGLSEVDAEVCLELLAEGDEPWTFHRAVDSALDVDHAWRALLGLPRLDTVLTAGSARGVGDGLDDLVRLARSNPVIAELMMAGGSLEPEHIPWLARAGVRKFHVGRPVRVDRSYRFGIDERLVHSWRTLIDETVARLERR